MKKTLFFFMGGLFLFGSCGDPELKVPALRKSQQPSVSYPDALDSKKRSIIGRVEDHIASTLNNTLFAASNYKVAEVHVCMANTAALSTTVTTVDRQF